jgi:hypothetical protein
VPITYEDPAYAYPGAIDDVTAAVRRGPAAPGPAGRVLVPRGGTISYTYGTADPEGAGAAARAALGNVLAGYRKLRGLDAFEVLDSGNGYLHVVPTGRLGRAGRPERATALLELPVTIPARERTAAALLDELCARLAEASGREVFVGTVPTGLLLGHATRLGAERERARAVLERLLRETGAPLSWQVLNDPGDGAYAVNVHLVGD